MNERMSSHIAVFVAAFNEEGKILLLKRSNTGYMDGYYDMPSGHLEPGESLEEAAKRELSEETTLTTSSEELELFHTYLDYESGSVYFGAMFKAAGFEGQPVVAEPDKCEEIGWFSLDELPKVTKQVAGALKNIGSTAVVNSIYR